MVNVPPSSTCLNCGYDLRGIGVEGKCPECGMGAGVSRSGDLLATAPAEYLFRVRLGAGVLRWACAAVGGVMIVGVVLWAMGFDLSHLPFERALSIVLTGIFVVGSWLVTTPQPGRFLAPAGNTARQVVRGAMAINLAVTVLKSVDTQRLYQMEMGLLGAAATVAGHVAMCLYLRAMGRRLWDEGMCRRAGRLMWMPIWLVVLAIWLGAFSETLGVCGVLGWYAWFVYEYWFVLGRFRSGLDRAAATAVRRELAEVGANGGEGAGFVDEQLL